MRPVKQTQLISSQLEILEEFKTQLESLFHLESLIERTNHAIYKGNSWIEGTNNETFLEVYTFLTNETVFLSRFLPGNEDCHQHSGLQEKEMMNTKVPGLDLRESKENKQLLEKCQEMDKAISLQSKALIKLEQKFKEQRKDKKTLMFRERKEIEKKYELKLGEIMGELHEARNFMSHLQTVNEDVMHQVKEHDKRMSFFVKKIKGVQVQTLKQDQKFETLMKQQKKTEKGFSLRLEEVMKSISGISEITDELKYDSDLLFTKFNEHVMNYECTILMFQGKLKDLDEHAKALDGTSKKKTGGTKRKRCNDRPKIKSTDPNDKNFIVSSQVDMPNKQSFSRQQAFFFAHAGGDLNVPTDLCQGQIVTSFGSAFENIGNHYNLRSYKKNLQSPM